MINLLKIATELEDAPSHCIRRPKVGGVSLKHFLNDLRGDQKEI